jgi:hypothetical protein
VLSQAGVDLRNVGTTVIFQNYREQSHATSPIKPSAAKAAQEGNPFGTAKAVP